MAVAKFTRDTENLQYLQTRLFLMYAYYFLSFVGLLTVVPLVMANKVFRWM